MPKTIKTAAELAKMITTELRKHPECDRVNRIHIIRPVTKNWDITVSSSRDRRCPPACRKILETTVQRLQALYDLPGKK